MSRRKYIQGIFRPRHPERYKGSQPILYRSSWELKFYRWCDNNSNVISWGSESVVIPYQSPLDGKIHCYFVDGVLRLKDKNNKIHNYLVEIKPLKQTLPPNPNRKKTKSLLREQYMYAVNIAKWQAAKVWCDKNNYKFKILTEKDLAIR